jgi:hypothetical protein
LCSSTSLSTFSSAFFCSFSANSRELFFTAFCKRKNNKNEKHLEAIAELSGKKVGYAPPPPTRNPKVYTKPFILKIKNVLRPMIYNCWPPLKFKITLSKSATV